MKRLYDCGECADPIGNCENQCVKAFPITIIECGPNRTCDHVFDAYAPLTDSDGLVCGETTVCSKCGESEFNLSMWD